MMPDQQVARVAVANETWQRFRQVAILRGLTVSAYLGQLVERELARRADAPVAQISTEGEERDQALQALSAVRQGINELDDIAGRLARSATAHGATWDDVASSLRITASHAQRAYAGRPGSA
jgi:hypothetical protein